MLHIRIVAAVVALGAAGPAAAQCGCGTANTSDFGDTRLSYSGGVVYDDDLVPGRGPNQPYLVDEQGGGGGSAYGYGSSSYYAARPVYREPYYGGDFPDRGYRRVDSPNLIGRDGRAYRR